MNNSIFRKVTEGTCDVSQISCSVNYIQSQFLMGVDLHVVNTIIKMSLVKPGEHRYADFAGQAIKMLPLKLGTTNLSRFSLNSLLLLEPSLRARARVCF